MVTACLCGEDGLVVDSGYGGQPFCLCCVGQAGTGIVGDCDSVLACDVETSIDHAHGDWAEGDLETGDVLGI